MKHLETYKNRLFCILFPALLGLGLALHILLPDGALSYTERRQLQQFPPLETQQIVSGNWTKDFESYLLDQFPAREAFRTIKSLVHYRVFWQSDKNGVYVQGQHVFSMSYPLNEGSVRQFANKLNTLYASHMQGSSVYLAVIPDKSQYVEPQTHLKLPYDTLVETALRDLNPEIQYIPIKDCLTLEDYYWTDLHWRQENLGPLLQRLSAYMGFSTGMEGLSPKEFSPFLGAYYGQASLPWIQPDTLVYLQSPLLEEVVVEDLQHPDLHAVYYTAGLGGMDSYDVYVNGATPLVTLRNPESGNGRELVVFRDSFGSSLAPLLLPGYDAVTLVDLRYMSSALLPDYVDLQGKDILFLYGEQILNNSALLK